MCTYAQFYHVTTDYNYNLSLSSAGHAINENRSIHVYVSIYYRTYIESNVETDRRTDMKVR